MRNSQRRVVIVGGGFTGLSAAYELAKRGVGVTVFESEPTLGGLAGSFEVPGGCLEKFYHHWFASDTSMFELVRELGLAERLISRPSRTGLYFANRIFRLASPMDLLRCSALSFWGRIRLGLLALRVRRVKHWKPLEGVSAVEWLRSMAGDEVYRVIWEPLLRGKFGAEAEHVSAVWFWNKLKLRGGSRGKRGREELTYLQGGFGALIDQLAGWLRAHGVTIHTNCRVQQVDVDKGVATGVTTSQGRFDGDAVLVTTAVPPFLKMCPGLPEEYRARLARIRYLANVCLVLALKRSLSDVYWLNVNDPGFPYVGIIEHTNFEPPAAYQGAHIVFLSKYLPTQDAMYRMTDGELLEFSIPHIQKMFPSFTRDWVMRHFVWRAEYAQPIITKHYSELIPDFQTPIQRLWLCTMAQIYPEDRGTNYAVQYGRRVAGLMLAAWGARPEPAGAAGGGGSK